MCSSFFPLSKLGTTLVNPIYKAGLQFVTHPTIDISWTETTNLKSSAVLGGRYPNPNHASDVTLRWL